MNGARRKPIGDEAAIRILVVEDDADIAFWLTDNLQAEGYVVESAEHGEKAEIRLAELPPDLVILDWMLPGVSGLEICGWLRAREATRTLPVIMLSGRGDEAERVRGLTVGADDYVVLKPFSLSELLARVRALLRRSRPDRRTQRLTAGDIVLDRTNQRVLRGSRRVQLGPTEFRLLEYLLEQPGRVFSRAQLLEGVLRQPIGNERLVDIHIGRLRRALSRGRERDPIRTVRSVGYSFDETFAKR